MLIGRHAAVLDACALHPVIIRGALLWLSTVHLFRPLWSEKILQEMRSSILAKQSHLEPSNLDSHIAILTQSFPDAMVAEHPFSLVGLDVPDANDAHVIGTAIVGRADTIVTQNLKDFPDSTMSALGLEAVHPDTFLVNLIDIDPVRAIDALKNHRAALTKSIPTAEDYLNRLENNGLIQTRARLLEFEPLL